MGMSTCSKCVLLARMSIDGNIEAAQVREHFMQNDTLKKQAGTWTVETLSRYISYGRRIIAEQALENLFVTWEFTMGRSSLFDSFTAFRSLMSLGLTPADTYLVVPCKLRNNHSIASAMKP